ncbi:hypothetical protein O3P69_007491 [Scylla paramamosain]|uniref:MADF domain-containing protein n=1 Tax=Scylla paramamosain TaxID=85552 RepID=A0AAW0V7G3_SCYPA
MRIAADSPSGSRGSTQCVVARGGARKGDCVETGDTALATGTAAAIIADIMTTDSIPRNIRFIQEVKKHPCIYNFTLQDYTKKHATEGAWQTVAAEMNDTVRNCKDKWKNLRTVFVRRMKPDPSGRRKTTKPYYLMDAMQFLLPFVRLQQGIKSTDTQKLLTPSLFAKKARTSSNYTSGGDCDGRGDGDDPRKLFLMSLVADVRAMTDAQMRKFRKLVLDAIDAVLDETPNGTPGDT